MTKVPDGAYMLTVTAKNRAGQSASAMVHFQVANDTPTATSGTGGEQPVYPLLGFLTPLDGAPIGFVVGLSGPDVPDQTRSIVLNDGQQRGRSVKPGRVWVTDPMRLSIQDGSSNT